MIQIEGGNFWIKGEVWDVPVSVWMSHCSSTICCKSSPSFLELLRHLWSKTRGCVFTVACMCRGLGPGQEGDSSEDWWEPSWDRITERPLHTEER